MNKLLRNQEYTLQTMCSYYVLMITVVVGGKKKGGKQLLKLLQKNVKIGFGVGGLTQVFELSPQE